MVASMIISYAQNFEDVMLWRALKHVEHGFYVDVGAQHPVVDSVSLAFYEHGWKGVHIEPVSSYANLLREHRPDEVVIQAAIGAKQGILTFFELPETGLSTADRELAYRHKEEGFRVHEVIVPCLTLAEALSPFIGRDIHWLKIDVEGYERQVLEGWGSEIKPWVVVIESTLPLTQTESYQDWERLILGLGYKFAYFDGLNRFFVASEHADLLSAFRFGPTVFDDFALSGSASAPFCTNLNSKIEELSQQGQALEKELRAREQQVIETSKSLEEREDKLAQFRERLQAVEGKLTQSRTQNDTLRESLSSAQQHAARVKGELDQTRERLQAVEDEPTQSRTQNDTLRESLSSAQQHAARAEGELGQTRERLQALEKELAEARNIGAQLEQHLGAREAELAGMYGSLSWRMTTPLREANLLFKRFLRMIGTGISALTSLPRRVAQRVLFSVLMHLQAQTERKARVARALARFPFLDAQLRALYRTHGHTQSSFVEHSSSQSVADSNMANRFRRQLELELIRRRQNH